MRYRLRTLLIALTLGPLALATTLKHSPLTFWNLLPVSLRPWDRSQIYLAPSTVDGSMQVMHYDQKSRRWISTPFDPFACH